MPSVVRLALCGSDVLTRIAEHLDHAICFGEPLVRQERNPHDLWRDLDAETA
jgi:hypothetical protein